MPQQDEWIRVTMEQFGGQLSKIQDSVADVRERLIKLEAGSLHTAVESLQTQLATALARVDALESLRDAREGTARGLTTAADWLFKLAPWGFAMAMVVVANADKL